jgi:hypothetical protein
VTMITVAYMIILYLNIPSFQLFPDNGELLIYLPPCGTSTRGLAVRVFPVYYGREYNISFIFVTGSRVPDPFRGG